MSVSALDLAWLERLGPWGPAGFVVAYALGTVAVIPGSLLTLGAGALFGVVQGSVYVLLGATLGAALAFGLARTLLRRRVVGWWGGRPLFRAVDRAVAQGGWWVVLLLRLSPLFPFAALNYALGITGVRFRDYLVASVGMVPGTVMYVYLGATAGDLAQVSLGRPTGWGPILLNGLGLLATIAVTVLITRRARRELDRYLTPSSNRDD
ncbi:MAG: TVP38/TMEM64 family protein, partial [Gloeomargaritaceae cyanobacterium C42_A2020_066]|nr:TVP38/TMEM64 family protein [Gloeomargaritaceae cyanobacterium C42_A2020_066]